jgi:hypothetical protein
MIEFRPATKRLPWAPEHVVPTVEVIIDGASLSECFAEVGSSGEAMLMGDGIATDLAIWGSGSIAESEAPEGFVPVLTCGCTVYGCGGSYASIRFKADTVEWSDFHNQVTDKPVRVGPYFFERSQYENTRRAFAPDR